MLGGGGVRGVTREFEMLVKALGVVAASSPHHP